MADWIPSLYALRAFEAVARHLSYKAAAQELNVTPAAVKQLVVKLEAAIGAKLVARDGNRLVLSDIALAGQNDIELAMRHMSEAVSKMRMPVHGRRLIVTVEASIAATWLVPKMDAFRAEHPGVDVLIDSSQKIVDLERSDVDVAIRYGVQQDERLISRRLFEDLVVPACSPSLANGPSRLINLNQLKDVPLIHWDLSQIPWAQATRRWHGWEEWLKHMGVSGVDASKGLRFSDYGMAVQAATSGRGVILAGWPVLQDQIEAGLLVCPFPNLRLKTDIGYDVVTTKEACERPDVSAFVDWLLKIASGYSTISKSASRV